MKMIYGGVPVNSLKVKHYEVSTNDATLKASDLQSGVTAYAKGRKVTGTGKSFEFATYGRFVVNSILPIPYSDINTVVVSSSDYAVKMDDEIVNLRNLDFSTAQKIGTVLIDNISYPLTITIKNNLLTFGCDKSLSLQALIGKDNYT